MKKFWAAVVVLAIAAGIYFLARKNLAPENSVAPPVSVSQNNSIATAPENSSSIPVNSSTDAVAVLATDVVSSRGTFVPPPDSVTNETQNLSPRMILDNARVAIRSYQDRFGENPVGNNSEITAALMGKNPKQVNFIAPESGLRVNENGELIDSYGTPFFFHQLSGKEMEIRSAGEDKKMWTFDDLITR